MTDLACPTSELLSAYLLGKLDDDRLDEIDQHVSNCESCQGTVVTLGPTEDTLLSNIRSSVPDDSYENEPGCEKVLAAIAAIGREPSFAAGESNVAILTEQSELGTVREYRLLAKLGAGGMGTVYKALHTKLEKVVALKVLPAERMQDPAAVERFEREMKAVGKLDHPNIVAAHDAGEADGTHYLVMELVDGVDLSALVRRVVPSSLGEGRGEGTSGIPTADACELIRQAALGLEHANRRGMVHRDIKPSNLMLAAVGHGQPQLKILDMGLALLDDQLAAEQRGLTGTGQMMGTLDYMAPEQGTDSHEVDIRADIYSLGATLFNLLTGQPPFPTDKYTTPLKLMMAKAMEDAPSLASVRSGLPPELVAIVDRMLARSVEQRYSTPQEVADALTPFCAGHDLTLLLEKATAEDTQHAHDESKVATHESLRSGSVETDPTLDMPDSEGQGEGLRSSPHAPREELTPASLGRESENFSDSIDSTLTLTPPTAAPSGATGSASALFPNDEPTASRATGSASARSTDEELASALAKPVAHGTTPNTAPSPLGEGRGEGLQPWYSNRRNQIITVAAALGGIVLLAAITLFFQTNSGTIVVEIDDPEGLIQVTVDAQDIVITDKNSGEPIRLKPGDHKLNVTRAGLEFSTDTFTLKRGEKMVLSVKLVEGQVQVMQGETPLGHNGVRFLAGSPEREVAEWVISQGGSVKLSQLQDYALVSSLEELPSTEFQLSWMTPANSKVTDGDLAKLAKLQRLPTLDLREAGITGAGFEHLRELQDVDALYLSGCGNLDPHTLQYLEGFTGLRELRLNGTKCGDETMRWLSHWPNLQQLAPGDNTTGEGLKLITACQKLQSLYLWGCLKLKPDDLRVLAQLPELQRVGLGRQHTTTEFMAVLSECPKLSCLSWDGFTNVDDDDLRCLEQLQNLRQLDVGGTGVTASGVNRLHRTLPNCRIEWDGGVIEPTTDPNRRAAEWVLNVGGSLSIEFDGKFRRGLTDAAELPAGTFRVWDVKLQTPAKVDDVALENLKGFATVVGSLTLRNQPITDTGVEKLISMPGLANLSTLNLSFTRISDSGVAHLKEFEKLADLQLEGTPVTDDGLKHISEMEFVSQLLIPDTQVTDAGIAHLRKLNLRTLHINNCRRITDMAVEHLREMNSLSFLELEHTSIGADGVKKLAAALPQCKIQWDGGVIEPQANTNRPIAEFVAVGDAAFAKGDLDGSLKSYGQAIENAPDDSQGYRGRGWVHLNRNDYAKALEDFNRAIQLDGNNGLAFGGRGWVYHHLGNFDEALKDLDQAVRLLPNYSNSRHLCVPQV